MALGGYKIQVVSGQLEETLRLDSSLAVVVLKERRN